MTDPQAQEWAEHEARQLAWRRCPTSGLPLRSDPDRRLRCAICDCIGGYPPEEITR